MSDLLWCIVIILLISIPGCVPEGDSWKRQYRRHVDTTSRALIKEIQDSLDQICLDRYEIEFRARVDSIEQVRMSEIKRLLQDE